MCCSLYAADISFFFLETCFCTLQFLSDTITFIGGIKSIFCGALERWTAGDVIQERIVGAKRREEEVNKERQRSERSIKERVVQDGDERKRRK